jgi:hypothetical protein
VVADCCRLVDEAAAILLDLKRHRNWAAVRQALQDRLRQLGSLVSVPRALEALAAEVSATPPAFLEAAEPAIRAAQAVVRAKQVEGLAAEAHEYLDTLAAAVAPAAPRKRRRSSGRKPAPLTQRQTEAMAAMAEHRSNRTAAAKALGISRQQLTRLCDKAMKKLGQAGMKAPRVQALPRGRRGEVDVDTDRATSRHSRINKPPDDHNDD